MRTDRRALVLTDESARHPLRRSLPPHLREQAVAVLADLPQTGFSRDDWRSFLVTFVATFVVVSVFIA